MPLLRRSLLLAAGVTALVFSLAGVAAAQDAGQPQAPGRGRRGGDAQFVPFGGPTLAIREALDKDKDGKLSADELKVAAESLATIDANKDGKLDAEEIGWSPQFGFRGRGGRGGRGGGGRGGFGGRGGAPPVDFSKRILSRDTNNDGKITADELPRSMRRVVELADQDKDAAIDAGEAEKFAQRYGAAGRSPR